MTHSATVPRTPDRGFWRWDGDVAMAPQPGPDQLAWAPPEVDLGFAATEVVTSWTATTPPGTWLQVDLRGRTEGGEQTGWFAMGRWSAGETPARTSVPGQRDRHGDVVVDRFLAADGHALTRVGLRATLHRPAGDTATPRLRSVAAVATRATAGTPPTPGGRVAAGVVLDVPAHSQQVHRGEYPRWGGGEAWCSPTCTAMVLAFWGSGPRPADLAWVDPAYTDPWVHHAVRGTWDHAYRGTGNWAFNTAYAGSLGLDAFVTRLRSLDEAGAFIAAGIPLVLSVQGHLVVLAGFCAGGDPVLNDPDAPADDRVRRRVDRAGLEAAWLGSSAGIAYVIHPASVPCPPVPGALA